MDKHNTDYPRTQTQVWASNWMRSSASPIWGASDVFQSSSFGTSVFGVRLIGVGCQKILRTFLIYAFFLCSFLFNFNSLLPSENDHSPNPRLYQLKIFGDKIISRDKIQNWFKLSKGDAVSKEIIKERGQGVLEKFAEDGFYFAKFDSVVFQYNPDSTRANVSIYINQGQKIKVDLISISGIDEAQKLVRDLGTQPGRDFNEKILQEDIESIIYYYENKGYPYCKVTVSDLSLDNSSKNESRINIKLKVDPGQELTIEEIEIVGNEQTKESVILRELPLEIGDIYNQRNINRIESKLQRLGYFKWVNPPQLELLNDNSGKLIIELAEGHYNRFDGVVGYNPGTQSSQGFVTGLIDISFGNLFGTGRQIEVHWQRRTEETQNLRIRYLEPWVGGLPLNAGFSFEQLIQDTSYVQRNLGLDFRFQFSEKLSFFTQVSKRDISPNSLGSIPFGIPKSNSLNLEVGLSYNTLDNLLNPSRGLHYTSAFEWGRKTVEKSSNESETLDNSSNQKRLLIDFETYFPLFRWQVLALAIHGRQVTSDEPVIPITEHYRLGGARTLRGYREEQFNGSRIAWANFEYRYLLGRYSRFFAFIDTGYFFRETVENNSVARIQKWKVGYGIGLRMDTRLGLFGIDYGLGEGDRLSNGKVHIGLKNEF